MTFTSAGFIPFVVLVWLVWSVIRQRGGQGQFWLVAAGLVFYGLSGGAGLVLLVFYILFGWYMGLALAVSSRPRLVLGLGLVVNLLGLAFFKYTPFILESVSWATGETAWVSSVSAAVPVPAGVSFFSFTAMAYLIEIYRGNAQPQTGPIKFGLFLGFFPKLMAGPIVRPEEFQVDHPATDREDIREARREAFFLLARGLFKKMVIADRIGLAVDPFFLHAGEPATAGVWALPYVYLYAFQIYFDFSGYTDMARGLGLWFGFRWPENFNRPYLSDSVRVFWRRWHMTLSYFFRDYVYISLGGNRKGGFRTGLNVVITTLLCGLWHGPSWSFVLWGGLHGGYMVFERIWGGLGAAKKMSRLTGSARVAYRVWCVFLTFNAVTMAWTFFRITDFDRALAAAGQWFRFDWDKALVGGAADWSVWALIILFSMAAEVFIRLLKPSGRTDRLALPAGAWAGSLIYGAGAGMLVLAYILAPASAGTGFIYFQF